MMPAHGRTTTTSSVKRHRSSVIGRTSMVISRSFVALFIASATLVLSTGCGDLVAPSAVPSRDASPLQTDALSYRLVRMPGEYRVRVQAKLVNTTEAPIYYTR